MSNEVRQVDQPQGFAVICAGDPNGAITAPKGTVAYDNITPAVWQNTNGVTTWVQIGTGGGGITSWGLETEAHFSGAGDPNGTVTALSAGDVYDDTTGTLWVATAADDVSWVNVAAGGGGGITSWGLESEAHFAGVGNPNGAASAIAGGDIYINDNGEVWIATAPGTADWILVGPGTGGPPAVASQSASGTVTVDVSVAPVNLLTLTGNVTTLNLTGSTAGFAADFTLYLIQDATGSRLVTWPASVLWPGGTPPLLSTAGNSVDVVVLESPDNGTTWYANLAGKAYS